MLRRMTAEERAARRAEFMRVAGEQWDVMFDPEGQEELRTFAQREEQACRAGDAVTRVLLEGHVREDEKARELETFSCPECGRETGSRDDGTPVAHAVVTRRGRVGLERPARTCRSCRRVLFPPRP